MGQRRTLGGDRIGSGKKMKVDTKTFNRSTHDLGYIWRSTMSAGTLVPFMVEVALPGDIHNIDLGCEVLTLPTTGPLFGSMKVQLDVYQCPVRLYQGMLHNNKLGIGLNMSQVKLPIFNLAALTRPDLNKNPDLDNSQVNPSSLLSYLGIRGAGILTEATFDNMRIFNAVPLLAYWDIFKNYYANKQEETAFYIHTQLTPPETYITGASIEGVDVPQYPIETVFNLFHETKLEFETTALQPVDNIMLHLAYPDEWVPLTKYFNVTVHNAAAIEAEFDLLKGGSGRQLKSWRYKEGTDVVQTEIELDEFAISNIDEMRERILAWANNPAPFNVRSQGLDPYFKQFSEVDGERSLMYSQEGLAVKTYQSDLFNNWLNTEYIDGVNGIAAVTAVSTAGDQFTIDSLILHRKVYDMLNDIMVSGGTYDDWLEVTYDHNSFTRTETPVYYGSLIKELVFQEVVSNSASAPSGNVEPLGTLAGRGRLGSKHKGGQITIKTDEVSFLIGIVSITPRIDYSQGNEWHTNLKTMDDFHKPHLDEIGFQELITDQMAWWSTWVDVDGNTHYRSAGKQPAWLNYMTNVNKIKGNFAIELDSRFMVLDRRYSPKEEADGTASIGDLTTYIDPRHFNHIFAQTTLDSQNFWVQIGCDITARRKLSARVMPNL